MEYPTPLDKNVFKLSTDLGIMKGWLQEIEQGEVSWERERDQQLTTYIFINILSLLQRPDLSALTNPSSALCMLKSLLTDGKLGFLVPSEIAKVIKLNITDNKTYKMFHRRSVNK